MRKYHGPLAAIEAHFAHHAPHARAHADDGALIAIDRGGALRQNLHVETITTLPQAECERATIQQPMPQARVGADG